MLLGSSIFLLPNATFFVELILFLVIFGVVAKVILPPIQAAMDERARTVRAAQEASDEGQAEAERLVETRVEVLERARAEAISSAAAWLCACASSRRRRASPISPLILSSRAVMVPPTLGTNTLANRKIRTPKIISIQTIWPGHCARSNCGSPPEPDSAAAAAVAGSAIGMP